MDHFQTVGHLKCAVYIKFFGGQKGGSLEPPRTPPAYRPDDALFSMTIGTDMVTIMFKNYLKQRICSSTSVLVIYHDNFYCFRPLQLTRKQRFAARMRFVERFSSQNSHYNPMTLYSIMATSTQGFFFTSRQSLQYPTVVETSYISNCIHCTHL